MSFSPAIARSLQWLRQPPLWFVLAACAAILAARRPDLVHTPQFWAEDGHFFERAYVLGWESLGVPYAGYHHLILRLMSWLAAACDPAWVPAAFVGLATAGTLYVVARTQAARCPLPKHIGCALAVVLVPDLGEVLLNIVNLQWVLAGGLLLLLISADARTGREHAHDGIAALLLGLTGPFSVALAPLFLLRAWQRRTRAAYSVAAVVVAAGAFQAWTIVTHPLPVPDNAPAVRSEVLLAVPGMRVAASLLVGYKVPGEYPLGVATALGVLSLAAAAALALRRGGSRPERIWLAMAFVVLLASALYRIRFGLPDLQHAGFGSRYFYTVQLIMLWLILAATADARRWVARTALVVAIGMLAINLPRLRENPFDDLHWENYVPQMRAGEQVNVPIHPAGWVLRLPARPAG